MGSIAAPPAPSPAAEQRGRSFNERALALWPRLDRQALRRCEGDPNCIAAVVGRRTSLPREAILALLLGGYDGTLGVRALDVDLWFG